MAGRVQRLILLERRVDAALHQFYYPNAPAVAAALKIAAPGMRKGQWRKAFAAQRRAQPKPPEQLLAPSVRTFKGPVLQASASHPDARFKGQYRNHLIPLLEVDKRGLGTGAGHAKVKRTMGFTTNRQPFVSRGEAKSLAKKSGLQLDNPQAPWRKKAWKGLHSSDVRWE